MKLINKFSAILFDFDGVLIDSIDVMNKAWNEIRINYKLEIEFKKYKSHIGIPIEKILSNLNIDSKLHDSIQKDYSKITRQNKNMIKLNQHAIWILNWLKENSFLTGIVTSKDEIRTRELIEYFQLDVNSVVTPEMTDKGKPSSEPIIYAANNLEVQTKQILYIGDMKSDMICASNAQCKYLHYLNGYEKLHNQCYGGEINSLKEIKEYLTFL
tara:strand:+ start:6686 stop:7324 length:639 start_codon:yes stop_codon:yes gene_type:complete